MNINTFLGLLFLVIVAAGLVLAGIFIVPILRNTPMSTMQATPVACGTDTKLCPNGSVVSRSGANCEFAVCPVTESFNKPINFIIGQKAVLSDGLSVTLHSINDSRCKANVVCIWAGELAPLFDITGGKIGNLVKEIQLGTATAKQITVDGYTFALTDATETSAQIIVSTATK